MEDEYIFEQLEKHIESQVQESSKWKARYEGKLEAYGNVLNKIRALRKQKEDEKRKNDDFLDAIRYSFAEDNENYNSLKAKVLKNGN